MLFACNADTLDNTGKETIGSTWKAAVVATQRKKQRRWMGKCNIKVSEDPLFNGQTTGGWQVIGYGDIVIGEELEGFHQQPD